MSAAEDPDTRVRLPEVEPDELPFPVSDALRVEESELNSPSAVEGVVVWWKYRRVSYGERNTKAVGLTPRSWMNGGVLPETSEP